MYEDKVISFLQNGYELTTSTDEITLVPRALRTLGINTSNYGKYVVGDAVFQKRMFDTTALSGIDLGTTAATSTQIVEAFDADTFVDDEASSNFTLATTKAITGEVLTKTQVAGERDFTITLNFEANDTVAFGGVTFTAKESDATGDQFNIGESIADSVTNLVSVMNTNETINSIYTVTGDSAVITVTEKVAGGANTPGDMVITGTGTLTMGTAITSKTICIAAHTPLEGYTLKKGDTTLTEGFTLSTATFTITASVAPTDVITLDYSYTTPAYLKATDSAEECTIVSNAYTVASTNNYVVPKVGTQTLGTGTIKYYVSRDGGTTYTQVYPGIGKFIGMQPTGNSFVFKIVINGNAELTGGIGFKLR